MTAGTENKLACLIGATCYFTREVRRKVYMSALAVILTEEEIERARKAGVCSLRGVTSEDIISVPREDYNAMALIIFQDGRVCTSKRINRPSLKKDLTKFFNMLTPTTSNDK